MSLEAITGRKYAIRTKSGDKLLFLENIEHKDEIRAIFTPKAKDAWMFTRTEADKIKADYPGIGRIVILPAEEGGKS